MRSPAALLLALLALALVAAGCGSPPHWSLAKTRACLQKKATKITNPTSDFVAESATAGTFRAWFGGTPRQFVTISFGDSTADAQGLIDGYARFRAKNIGLSDILYTDKNAVLLWREKPSDAELKTVRSCLK